MLISQDVIRKDILGVKDGENTLALPLMQELLLYGHRYSEIVILEGILHSDWYQPLFELAIQLYKTEVYAYYFAIPFKETLRRHKTKANCHDFGEDDMKRWWREKDFSSMLKERVITSDKDQQGIVAEIDECVRKMEDNKGENV